MATSFPSGEQVLMRIFIGEGDGMRGDRCTRRWSSYFADRSWPGRRCCAGRSVSGPRAICTRLSC